MPNVTISDFPITIYHNSDCGTSRNVLAMIRAAGYEPRVIDYRRVGWTKALLEELLLAMGAKPRDVLRKKGTPAHDLGLFEADRRDDDIVAAMIEHPILVDRPIVVTPLGTKLCRPSEVVLSLLMNQPDSFSKEDGEVVAIARQNQA